MTLLPPRTGRARPVRTADPAMTTPADGATTLTGHRIRPTLRALRPAGRLPLRGLGLVTVPLVVAGLLMWAVGGTGAGQGAAVAAVVNDDRPVTIQGQPVPLGRQLAGLLVDGSDEQFRWVLTSAADARRGLADGDYTALVTVPPSFSEHATSAAASNDAAEAAQGIITVTTARDSAVTDAAVARRVVDAATTALNAQVVSTYLENVYLGFTTLHDELGEAADGAARLKGGTGQASTGARRLSDGAIRLGGGSRQLAAGAQQLAAGTGQLADGARQLSAGLSDARRQTADLPARTRALADGAGQVAQGNEQLAATVVPVADAAIAGIDALPELGSSVDALGELVQDCPRLLLGDFCARLDQVDGAVRSQSNRLDQRRGGLRGQIVTLRDGVAALADGSRQVADGTRQLAQAAPQLVGGLAQASDGARRLADGSARVDDGAHRLAVGARLLDNGSGRLATGAGQLADGVTKVHDGMTTLTDGLSDARTRIPTFTAQERSRLAKAVATPALVQAGSTATDRLAGSLYLVLALWLGAFVVALSLRSVPPALASSGSTWGLAATAARPAILLATATGVVAGAPAAVYLGLGFGRAVALVAVTVLVAVVFALVNQALAALLGNAGRAIALVAVLVTAVVGITSTSPSELASLARLLPTHDAGTALRAVTMGGGRPTGAVVALVLWAGVAAAGTAWAVERQRTVPARLLRPPVIAAEF